MDRILVVDDESGMRIALTEVLERHGFAVTAVETGAAALSALTRDEYALVISDMRMPVMTGAELLEAAHARWPRLPMVMMTAYGTIEDAVGAMKVGARDFLTKPFSPQDLLHLVRVILHDGAIATAGDGADVPDGDAYPSSEAEDVPSAADLAAAAPRGSASDLPATAARPSAYARDHAYARASNVDAAESTRDVQVARAAPAGRASHAAGEFGEAARRRLARPILTRSPALLRVLSVAEGVAASRAPVLIQGESGTGKELLARYIHAVGPRRQQPFVAVNCAALPRDLLESELFGHERGAFTGALARKLGKFELASGGTLLLDEISEMEPLLQAKLLRVLQEHEVDRVGGIRPIPIDARVIATTNRPLRALVAAGAFRRDLYYRLHVVPLTVPPLRERREDVELLVEHFGKRFGGGAIVIEPAARIYLQTQPWPGNVRELEHVIERALLLAGGRALTLADVQLEEEPLDAGTWDVPTGKGAALRDARAGAGPALAGDVDDENEKGAIPVAAPDAGVTVHEMERRLIVETLRRTNNNRTHAARMLGISVRTLRNKLHQYRTATNDAALG